MDKRESLPTALRQSIWKAHDCKCAYTGEPLDWSELQIDHIIALRGDEKRKQVLETKGIINGDFDVNGYENLLPTKGHRNRQKTNHIYNDATVIYYLSLASQKKDKAKRLFESFTDVDASLKGYLQLKVQAEKNDINVDEMFEFIHHQEAGEVPLKVSPELDGAPIARANSEYAAVLMDKPFALGGGSINEVNLHGDAGDFTVCTTANQFLDAKARGLYPLTQYEMTTFGLADQTSELLKAVRDSNYAKFSELRSPMVTLNTLDRWASIWAQDCFVDEPDLDISAFTTLASLIDNKLLRIDQQSAWLLTVVGKSGIMGVQLRELMRADLDGDSREEVLVFHLTYATQGTLRAGVTQRAKMMADGLLWPVNIE